MSINRTIVHTWIADSPRCSVQAKTEKEARLKIQKQHGTKAIKNLRKETPP